MFAVLFFSEPRTEAHKEGVTRSHPQQRHREAPIQKVHQATPKEDVGSAARSLDRKFAVFC